MNNTFSSAMSKQATANGPTNELTFKVGQLACALIGIPEESDEFGCIGRIADIDGENVVLVSYDDDKIEVKLSNLKQAVHFDIDKPHHVAKGFRATCFAMDHPVLGATDVHTSTVLRINEETGFFETRNTAYMANRVDHWFFGSRTSPFLTAE